MRFSDSIRVSATFCFMFKIVFARKLLFSAAMLLVLLGDSCSMLAVLALRFMLFKAVDPPPAAFVGEALLRRLLEVGPPAPPPATLFRAALFAPNVPKEPIRAPAFPAAKSSACSWTTFCSSAKFHRAVFSFACHFDSDAWSFVISLFFSASCLLRSAFTFASCLFRFASNSCIASSFSSTILVSCSIFALYFARGRDFCTLAFSCSWLFTRSSRSWRKRAACLFSSSTVCISSCLSSFSWCSSCSSRATVFWSSSLLRRSVVFCCSTVSAWCSAWSFALFSSCTLA
mmetsp:Transcript_291/g.518  ORF Transcript_291/g.518 Transcript_291/m.518 type:complete len:287 (-) Transcript_291:946-1806(-)